jgi:hypothetical protein
MMMRTQISLDREMHRRAKRRAAELGVSLSELTRRALDKELAEPEPEGDIGAIFDLGNSGGSDVATHKGRYLADAIWREHQRKTGRTAS